MAVTMNAVARAPVFADVAEGRCAWTGGLPLPAADVGFAAAKVKFASGRCEWTGGLPLPDVRTWRLWSRSKKGRRRREEAVHAAEEEEEEEEEEECTWSSSSACAGVCSSSSEMSKLVTLQEGRCTGRSAGLCLHLQRAQHIFRTCDRQMTSGGRWSGGGVWFCEEKRACSRCKWARRARINALEGYFIKGDKCFVKSISSLSMTQHSSTFHCVPFDSMSRRFLSLSPSLCSSMASSVSRNSANQVGAAVGYGRRNLVRKRMRRKRGENRWSHQLAISHIKLPVCSSYSMEGVGDLIVPPRTDDDYDHHHDCYDDDDDEEEEEEGGDKLVAEKISREESLAMSTTGGQQVFVVSDSSQAASVDGKQQQQKGEDVYGQQQQKGEDVYGQQQQKGEEVYGQQQQKGEEVYGQKQQKGEDGYGTEKGVCFSSGDANIEQEHEVRAGVQRMEGTEVEIEEVEVMIMTGSSASQEGKRRPSEGMELWASALKATAKEAERRARRSAERVKALRATLTCRSTTRARAKAALDSAGQSKGRRRISGGPSFSSPSDKCQSSGVQVDEVGSRGLSKRGPSGTSSWIALVGDHPPLSRQEETSLSKDVRDLQALLSKKEDLSKRLGREPSDLEWAESEGISLCRLLARIGKGRAAKRRMVEANLKLVESIAERFGGRGLSHNDLCQEGVKGLLRSAEKYDSSKNVKFSTYSFDWIRQKIGNALRMYAKPVKIGRTAWDKMWVLLSRKQALSTARGGQPVSLEEAAIGSGVSPSVVRALDLALTKSVPLDVPLTAVPSSSRSFSGNGSDLTLEATVACVPAADTCPWKAVDELLMRREVNQAVSQLGPHQRDVIRLHFGLGGEEPHLKKEVAKELRVTSETVRIQEKRGLQRLKDTWGVRLEPYLAESSSPPS